MTCMAVGCDDQREYRFPLCAKHHAAILDVRVSQAITQFSMAGKPDIALSIAADWYYTIAGQRVWTKWDPESGLRNHQGGKNE